MDGSSTPPGPEASPAKATPVPRGPGGKFVVGHSGNPLGTPGERQAARNKLRALMQQDGEAIAAVVLAQAKEGNLDACSLVLARLAPPLRPQGHHVNFKFDLDAPLMEQAQQVVAAVATGELTVDEGHMLVQCLTNAAGLKTVDELAARIAALEGRGSTRPRQVGAGMVVDADLLKEPKQ